MNLFLLQFRQFQCSRPKNAPIREVNFFGNLQSFFDGIAKDLLAKCDDVFNRVVMCQKSVADNRFAKYPPQPVVNCVGFEKTKESDDSK